MTSYHRTSNPRIWNAKLLGRIEGCTNPESCDLLPDGETFVFGNCAMSLGHPAYRKGAGLVYVKGHAFVSRGRVSSQGEVRLIDRQLVSGLTATLGLDILRRRAGRFPEGSVFIAEGANPATQPGEDVLIDRNAMKPRALVFDPMTGRIIGEIGLHKDSPIGRRFGAFDQPNGLTFDMAGNLYVGDIPNGNPVQAFPPPSTPGVYRIPHAALDALAEGDDNAASGVRRIDTRGFINGLAASPLENVVWAVSCLPDLDPANGGIYRLEPDDFENNNHPEPIIRDMGLVDGVGCTRRGTLLASTPLTGEVHAFASNGDHYTIKIGGENIVRMPADFNVCYPAALKGEPAILTPDISVGAPPGDASVCVVDISGL